MSRTRTARMAALTLTVLLGATACSDGGDPDGSETAAPVDDRRPDDVLESAVDKTLTTNSFTIDYSTALQIGETDLELTAEGRVDYDAAVADVAIGLDQDGQSQDIGILSDGTTTWVSGSGGQVPEFPDGATYVSGDAAALRDAATFTQENILGLVYVLRAGDDAEAGDLGEADGVETRTYSFTVPYTDAVEAAGEDAEAFQSALSLTGDGEDADLVVEVEIGSDDVVRRLTLDIDAGSLPLSGDSELELSDVGADVEPPEAPADDEVATGPEADAIFEQLLA